MTDKRILCIGKNGGMIIQREDGTVEIVKCNHPPEQREQMATGSKCLVGGELIDTTNLVEVCLLCGAVVYDESERDDSDEIPY